MDVHTFSNVTDTHWKLNVSHIIYVVSHIGVPKGTKPKYYEMQIAI